jgi:topoisomerase-4 subunit A
LATKRGFGFLARLADMNSRQRAGKQFITLEANDALLRPVPLFEGAKQLGLWSVKGKFLVFGVEEIKTLSAGGRGTILIGLDADDQLAQTVPIGNAGLRVTGIYRNKPSETILAGARLAPYVSKRARKGRLLDLRAKQPLFSPVI